MKKRTVLLKWTAALVMGLAMIALAACPSNLAVSNTYTVSGTVTLTNIFASGNATVTVTQGGSNYTVSVAIPTSVNPQTLTYSIPNVPSGNYSAAIVFQSTYGSVYAWYSDYYSLNGTQSTDPPAISPSGPPYTWTESIPSLSLNSDTKIDLVLDANMG